MATTGAIQVMAITALGYDNMYKFFLSKEVILLLILVVIFITLLFFIIFLQNDNISNDESGLHYYNPPSDSNAIFNNAICHSVVAKNATYCREIPQKDIQADCIYESVIFLSLIESDRNRCNDIIDDENHIAKALCISIHDRNDTMCTSSRELMIAENGVKTCINIIDNAKEWFENKDERFFDLFKRNYTDEKFNELLLSIMYDNITCNN